MINSMFENFVNYPYPIAPNVYVISDSDYKNYQQKEAYKQLTVLESQLNRYKRMVEETKLSIEELKTNAGLLPEDEAPKIDPDAP